MAERLMCVCGCREGAVRKNGHVYRCACPSCRGKRNRVKGDGKAREARKQLGIAGTMSRHEETWDGPVRVECKAGKQVAPVATAFLRAETQSEASRQPGDDRAFMLVCMPDGWGIDGLVVMRLGDHIRQYGT